MSIFKDWKDTWWWKILEILIILKYNRFGFGMIWNYMNCRSVNRVFWAKSWWCTFTNTNAMRQKTRLHLLHQKKAPRKSLQRSIQNTIQNFERHLIKIGSFKNADKPGTMDIRWNNIVVSSKKILSFKIIYSDIKINILENKYRWKWIFTFNPWKWSYSEKALFQINWSRASPSGPKSINPILLRTNSTTFFQNLPVSTPVKSVTSR